MTKRTITQAILCAISPASTGAPEIIQVLPIGNVIGRDKRAWKCSNPQTVINNTELPAHIDYDHQTELPIEGQSTPTIAAGWIRELLIQDGHICARVEWTPKATQHIIDKEYAYVSPAFLVKNGEIWGLTSVGLTNKPNLALSALNSEGNMEFLQKLAAMLGLTPEQATEESVLSAVTALIEEDKNEPPATPPATNSAEYVSRADYEKVINALTATKTETNARLEKIESVGIEAAVCEAEKAGKCYPFEHEMNVKICKSEGIEKFRTLMEKRPQLNVTQEVASDAGKPPPTQQGSLTPEEIQVCRIRNISEEEFLKVRGVA